MTHKRIVPPLAAALLTVAAFVVLTACGSSGGSSGAGSSASPGPAKLTVFAASSLNKVFPQIATAFQKSDPGVGLTFNFAGTDTLATQIEQGAPADVFAGASAKYGDELSGKGLIATPRIFATNQLVLIVPAADPAHISSLRDLTKPGVKLVVGDATVPIGTYTRKVLANLDATYGPDYSAAVLKNVVSNETEVTGVLSSVELGEADAGFVYVTDARNGGDKVKSITLPASAQAVASYPVATVVSSKSASAGRRFADFLLGAQAQAILRAAGFGPPPK